MNVQHRKLTERTWKILRVAADRAASFGRSHATPEDVLWALATVHRGPGRAALECLGLNIAEAVDALDLLVADESLNSDDVVQEAHSQSQDMGHDYVGSEHLVLAVLAFRNCSAAQFLRERGITEDNLRSQVKDVLSPDFRLPRQNR